MYFFMYLALLVNEVDPISGFLTFSFVCIGITALICNTSCRHDYRDKYCMFPQEFDLKLIAK